MRGSACGPPPEKLMMSMPSLHRGLERRDDLGAVRGAAATERRRRGDVEDAVVADVRARRDSLDILHRRVAAACRLDAEPGLPGLDVGLDSRDDPGDEGPVERVVAVERRAVRARPGEAPRDDHLGRRRPRRPLREARREREAPSGRGTDAPDRRRRRRRPPSHRRRSLPSPPRMQALRARTARGSGRACT